jgi:hypothetical protein
LRPLQPYWQKAIDWVIIGEKHKEPRSLRHGGSFNFISTPSLKPLELDNYHPTQQRRRTAANHPFGETFTP